MLEIPEIRDAHVILLSDSDLNHLCAYYVSASDIEERTIRKMLGNFLPDYMIPSFLVPVDSFELNNNGKIDVSKLPDSHAIKQELSQVSVTSDRDIHQELHDVFSEILGYDTINPEMDFFTLGGTSLQLVRLHSEIDVRWPEQMLISDLFELTTLNAIADFLQNIPGGSQEEAHDPGDTSVEFLEI